MPTQGSSTFPNFTPGDFTDPTLFKFNTAMQLLYEKISALYQGGITTTLGANLVVPQIDASNQASPPTDPNALITLQTANALFGPQAQRAALATSQSPSSTIVVQPISGGGAGGGPSPSDKTVSIDGIVVTGASQSTSDTKGDNLSINMFGAIPDLIFLFDGVTNSTNNLTSATASFKPSDVGKSIWIEHLSGGSDFITSIATVVSSHHVTLTLSCPFTETGAQVRYFTDNTAAIQAAIDTVNVTASRGIKILIPAGNYGTLTTISVSDCTWLAGEGWSVLPEDPITTQIVCCGNVAVFSNTTTISSFVVEKLVLQGTSRSGSSGVVLNQSYGSVYRDVSFYYFGNYAIFEGNNGGMGAGFTSRLEQVNTDNCMLVRTGWAQYVGVVDIATTDIVMDGCVVTSGESYNGSTLVTGAIGTGFISAIAIRGGNSFIHDTTGHGSEVGFFCGPTTGSVTTFIDCRADQNQGQGYVITAAGCRFIGCRSHNNSWDATGTYNAWEDLEGGNRFTACSVTTQGSGGPGGATFECKNGFYTLIPSGNEASHFIDCLCDPGTYSNQDYFFDGTGGANQSNVVLYPTNLDPSGVPNLIARANVSVRSSQSGQSNLYIVNQAAGTNEKVWALLPYPTTLHLSAFHDDYTTEQPILEFLRSSGLVTNVVVDVPITMNIGEYIDFLTSSGVGSSIFGGIGSPNGVITANGGFLFLDATTPALWIKASGSGNTGWVATTGGISQLTGDVTAGPGSGSVAATLAKIQTVPVVITSLTSGQVLEYNGTDWVNATLSTSGGGVNAQTGSYTPVSGDNGKLITVNSGSAATITLPNPPLSSTFRCAVQNLSANPVAVSHNSLDINTATNDITLQQYQLILIWTDGSNYFATVPLVAGTGVAVSPASNQTTISASGGSTPGPSSSYSPTVGNLTSVTVNSASYLQFGKWCFVRIQVVGTGSAFVDPTITLPATPVSGQQTLAVDLIDTTLNSTVAASIAPFSGTTMTITPTSALTTHGYQITISGIFETT